jgi:methyl-accepting chemotaxis protein
LDTAPQLALDSYNIRRHAIRASSKGYLGADDRMGIRIFRERQQAGLAALQDALPQVPAQARIALQGSIAAARSAADDYYATVRASILESTNIDTAVDEIYQAGLPAAIAMQGLCPSGYDLLSSAVQDRLQRADHWRLISAGCTAVAFLAAILLSIAISRSLSLPMQQAASVFERISAGHYDNTIAVPGTDEASQVLAALARMQDRLRTRIEAERSIAAENARIREALDKASTSILLADPDHRIIYLNPAARSTFARADAELRKSLPHFDATALRGSGLELLSTEPAAERRLLQDLREPQIRERALGDLTFRVVTSPVLAADGERLGTVMEWIERTQEVGIETGMRTLLGSILDGDLTGRIPLSGKSGFFESASRGINQLADHMAAMVALVKDAAEEVYRGSRELASGNSNLQQRTEEQAASLEETASSMEQMTGTVRQNAANAGEANQLAMAAREQAESGGQVVGRAVTAMADISESARKIADIIGVIDEIAFQTNLLALNAAVEAARAGEQGRGFAVVATEVRTLAGRSAGAAKEIKALIHDSVGKVKDGAVFVSRSGQTLEQIVASVKKVSDIVAEIAAASHEQSAGIAQVNRAVSQMDDLTQQNAALVEQAATASQTMAQEAHALFELMGGYRLGEPGPSEAAPQARGASDGTQAVRSAGKPRSPGAARANLAAAAAVEDGGWQEF